MWAWSAESVTVLNVPSRRFTSTNAAGPVDGSGVGVDIAYLPSLRQSGEDREILADRDHALFERFPLGGLEVDLDDPFDAVAG